MYQDVFKNIYENNGFGSLESKSGPGSTLEETKFLREKLVTLCKEKNIKIVIDIPCGDFNWMKTIVDNFELYIGGDIVDECINTNNLLYGSSNIKFIHFDLLNDSIPDGDLLIVRDVIGHFPLKHGVDIVNTILKSNCKYLLSTTWYNIIDEDYHKTHINNGAEFGRFYPVNLMSAPFNFPKPEFYIEEDVYVDNYENGNRKVLALWDLEKIKKETTIDNINHSPKYETDLTIVTGLWDIGRPNRDFSIYIEHFINFLDFPVNMFIYIPKKYEYLVWKKRSRDNTVVKTYELEDVKNLYSPHWDKTQEIRNDSNWLNQTGENGWLKSSPQAVLEWYNPIVQSKMFLLNDVTIWNPFNTNYFIWLDAGITNTVYEKYFIENNVFEKIIPFLNDFLFLSYPYDADKEIHGFDYDAICKYSENKVSYVCRGGLFGGHKEHINQANGIYYSLLSDTLNSGYMGTEESIFTIMSYKMPDFFKRYALDGNGLIVKFIQNLIDGNVTLEKSKQLKNKSIVLTPGKYKTNLYILTFNFPEQVQHTINSMEKTPEWLNKPKLILLDNSTIENSKIENQKIAERYNMEYIDLGGNTGICGGRQKAAEHFHESDADFMFFFEDDMTCNPPEYDGMFCRNGFRRYIPNLYDISHKIMLREEFDFLKLTFTEVYFDNDKQCSWYNVPQTIRTRDWPDYDKLPITGLDPNVPLTNFKNIRNMDGVSYIDGEIYYANWPMIVSKEGNKKMFIDTKWANPFEQTWMSHMYQLTKEGKLKPAVLLASPILHERIMHYTPEERREN